MSEREDSVAPSRGSLAFACICLLIMNYAQCVQIERSEDRLTALERAIPAPASQPAERGE